MTHMMKEDVRAALREVREAQGPEAVASLLQTVAGVNRFDQLSESHFAAVLKAAKPSGAAVSAISTRDRIQEASNRYWDSRRAKADVEAE